VLLVAVKLVLEAVCILKGVKPIRMKDAQSGAMIDSYWAASQKMLVDEDFLVSLK
jgi:dynein heavy chain